MSKTTKKEFERPMFFTRNVLVGIIICLLCAIFIIAILPCSDEYTWVDGLLIPCLSAIIAGFIVSFVIDIKKQVSGIQSLIVKSFTEHTFLESLDDNEISKLRENALAQLIRSKYPNMQHGIIEKDSELSDALTKPYYEVFRETGVYYRNKKFAWVKDGLEENVLFRKVDIQYTLKSPKSLEARTTANISIGKSLQIPSKNGDIKKSSEIFKLNEFSVIVDNKTKVDLVKSLQYQTSELSEIEDYYNQKISIVYNGGDLNITGITGEKDGETGIFVDYNESIDVHINYDIYLPIEDNHFTNRLKYPAKSYRIDCLCNDDENVRFYGELLGTFTKRSQVKITHPKDNVMSIEALDWLLPKNGVFVIMCKKKENNNVV